MHREADYILQGKVRFTPLNYHKSYFQPLTTKSHNKDDPAVETEQIWPLGGF